VGKKQRYLCHSSELGRC